MKVLHFLIPFVILLPWHCQNPDTRPEAKLFDSKNAELSTTAYLLIFKAENTLELWATTTADYNLQLESYPIAADANTPLGLFSLPQKFDEQGYTIPFPNDFYKQKQVNFLPRQPIFLTNLEDVPGFTIQLTEPDWVSLASQLANFQQIHVLIFPNDARKSGNLTPCMHCPYWMAEIYSQLYAHLQHFTDEPTF